MSAHSLAGSFLIAINLRHTIEVDCDMITFENRYIGEQFVLEPCPRHLLNMPASPLKHSVMALSSVMAHQDSHKEMFASKEFGNWILPLSS
jgi:hypothetical protein